MLFRVVEYGVVGLIALFFVAVAVGFASLLFSFPREGFLALPFVFTAALFILLGWRRMSLRRKEKTYNDPDIQRGSAQSRRFNDPVDPEQARRDLG